MRVSNDNTSSNIDYISIIEQFKEQYRLVYWETLYDTIYIYRPLGRKEYKDILMNEQLNDLDKEDEIVRTCLLFPSFDLIENSEAGLITNLCQIIIKNSYMEDLNMSFKLINYYRQEMYELSNQINCIINEAFPSYDIEEIENWDVDRMAKYLSRAEWKLQNFRGQEFSKEYFDVLTPKEENQNDNDILKDTKDNTNNKEKMTPEKLAELKAKFPEIDWEHDSIIQNGEASLQVRSDTTPVALRPMSQMYKKE